MKTAALYAQISEAVFTAQVIKLAQVLGWRVAHFRPAMTKRGRWVTPVQGDSAGFPDLILVKRDNRRREVIAAELKSEKGKVSKEQQEWLDAFIHSGCRGCVWRPSMIEAIEAILR